MSEFGNGFDDYAEGKPRLLHPCTQPQLFAFPHDTSNLDVPQANRFQGLAQEDRVRHISDSDRGRHERNLAASIAPSLGPQMKEYSYCISETEAASMVPQRESQAQLYHTPEIHIPVYDSPPIARPPYILAAEYTLPAESGPPEPEPQNSNAEAEARLLLSSSRPDAAAASSEGHARYENAAPVGEPGKKLHALEREDAQSSSGCDDANQTSTCKSLLPEMQQYLFPLIKL